MTSIPGDYWRSLSRPNMGKELPKGLDAGWNFATGFLRRTFPYKRILFRKVDKVIAHEKEYETMSEKKLGGAALDFRELFRRDRESSEDVCRAFALVREVAWRELGEKPYPVQVAAALALNDGYVAEMATGEGKTLSSTMPAVIAGWKGKGCHVITANDYLAKRDAEWMKKIYRFCGLTAECVEQKTPRESRVKAYEADITYCTNKEAAADFLRDRLLMGRSRGLGTELLKEITRGLGAGRKPVQRGLAHAIVDEADSVLIDEAVTPLIISGEAPNAEQTETFVSASSLGEALQEGVDYTVDFTLKKIELTKHGKRHIEEKADALGGIWKGERRREELIIQALTARVFYLKDKQYVIADGKIVIVDEFTGRLMQDRTWRDGLHQAVEAKEGVEVKPPKETYARISFQRFFRMYGSICGMSGTVLESWRELWQIYRLPVVVIPTNRPLKREILGDRVFKEESGKWEGIAREIKTVHKTGRPLLVGTRSVAANRKVSEMLHKEGLGHQVLDAVNEAEEAKIIAKAGEKGKITVATNMAGRGTDIKLGEGVPELGGLHVIATERHESGRIDRQLFGRSARQGDPGSAVAFLSLEDELVARHAPLALAVTKGLAGKKGTEVSGFQAETLFNMAQANAEKKALAQRKSVLGADNWLDEVFGYDGT